MNAIITIKNKEKLYAYEIMESTSENAIFSIVSLISRSPNNIDHLCELVYNELNISIREICVLAEIELN